MYQRIMFKQGGLMRIAGVILFTIILLASTHANITPELEDQIVKASPGDMISCIVVMKTAYPYEAMRSESAKARIQAYKSIAWESQQPLINWLSARSSEAIVKTQFWVLNGMYMKAMPHIILAIAKRGDVETVFHNEVVTIRPVSWDVKAPASRSIEWNLQKIEADKCWTDGYTGEGVIIGIIDSGVDYLHPALAGKWSGHWFVASGLPQKNVPYDDFKHGTHCMGTIVGGDGPGSFENDIGVAPGAKFAAAKGLNSGGSGSSDQLTECIQFMANLKATVNIKAVSCSWVHSSGGDPVYWEAFKTLLSVGVLPIIANGNNGGAGNVQTPGDYPHVVGVGATDSDDKIASFSSLGPATQKAPYNDKSMWIRQDWNYIKPNITAPGVSIRSCVPNGGYEGMNGTSMATPHVCGAVALICQKNKTLAPEMIYNLLVDNTDKPGGDAYPNNTFGWGRLNVYKVLNATPAMNRPWIYLNSKNMSALSPGQTVDFTLNIKNVGGIDAENTKIIVVTKDNYISVQPASFGFGTLKPQQIVENTGNPFKISAHQSTPEGRKAALSLIISADGPHDSLDFHDTVAYTFIAGTAPSPIVIYEDDFEYLGNGDSLSFYWEATGNWKRSSSESNSPAYSASSGTFTSSNSLILRNGVDLSRFADAELSFFDKHKFAFPENWTHGRVSVSTNNGTSWSQAHDFAGASGVQSWKANTVSLSSFQATNVKIRFDVYAQTGSPSSAEWWVDDVKIRIPADNESPDFANTTIWKETHLKGPFPVQSAVTDKSGVQSADLYYKVNSSAWNKIPMAAQAADMYGAEIPVQTGTGTIHYYLEASDKWFLTPPNKGAFPIGASQTSEYVSFIYGSTGIFQQEPQNGVSLSRVFVKSGKLEMRFSLQQESRVKISLFDCAGRTIGRILEKNIKQGAHTVSSAVMASGVCFIHFETASAKTKNGGVSENKIKIERLVILK